MSARTLIALTFFAAVMALLAGYVRHDVAAWLDGAHIETSARLECPRPIEQETVLVFIRAEPDGAVRVSCGHGGRGRTKAL